MKALLFRLELFAVGAVVFYNAAVTVFNTLSTAMELVL